MPRILTVGTPNQSCGPVELVGTQSSGVFLLNTAIDGAVGTTALLRCSKTTNPAAVYASVLAADNNVSVINVPPGWNWLEVFMKATATSSTTIGTSSKFVAFGFFPREPLGNQQSALPGQLPTVVNSYKDFDGEWLPLENPVAGTMEQDLGTTIALLQDVTTPSASDYPDISGISSSPTGFLMTPRKSVALSGARRVMLLPSQAVIFGGSGGSAPMLVGKFTV